MDRNDLQVNGRLDHNQNLTEYTSCLCASYSVKIKNPYLVVFFYKFLKKLNSTENSKNFTGLGPYHANTHSVRIFQKCLILFILEQHKEYSLVNAGIQQNTS